MPSRGRSSGCGDRLRGVARARLAEVEQLVTTYLTAHDHLEPVSRDELAARLAAGEAIVLDVRPRGEYEAGHVAGARSIPVEELEARLAELPADQEIIAYCCGPYWVFAPSAVELLRRHGFHARRLVEGFPDWRLAGLPVAIGSRIARADHGFERDAALPPRGGAVAGRQRTAPGHGQ